VKIAFHVPKKAGGYYDGSVTVTADHDAVTGVELPPVGVGLDPGTYTYSATVSSGRISTTKSVTLTVTAP
jgi:hypothetical protein